MELLWWGWDDEGMHQGLASITLCETGPAVMSLDSACMSALIYLISMFIYGIPLPAMLPFINSSLASRQTPIISVRHVVANQPVQQL